MTQNLYTAREMDMVERLVGRRGNTATEAAADTFISR